MASEPAARLALLCATVSCSIATQVQDSMQKLEGFKSTGASLNIETAPQSGARAAALKTDLKQVRLPPGFKVDLYAIVPDARHTAAGPNAGMVFVGMRRARVWTVSDRTKNRVVDEVEVFAPSINFKIPNDLRFSPDGVLYVAEQNRVLAFPAVDFFYESPDVAMAPVVPQRELVPVEEESFNHTARTCRIGPDGKLYITLGNPFNVSPKKKVALYDKVGMVGIIRMNRDGKHREVFARSVRNSIGMGFNPKDKTLWFTDNQVDGMGDDIPSGRLNRATKVGKNFDFPWYDGGHICTVEYRGETPSSGVIFPQVEMVAHAADLGMASYKGGVFPIKCQGSVFNAQRGSWSRTTPVGARIMYTPIRADGTADKTGIFAEGWSTSNNGYLGRPADVATLPDDSLLISDDYAGAVCRVLYAAE